jgi:outer membrane protein TolC
MSRKLSRKRWIRRILAGALALGTSGGCKQQLFLEPADYRDAVLNTLPRDLENNPHDTITPSEVNRVVPVSTVLDPERPARLITLQECLAIALEQGNTGNPAPNNFGLKLDNPGQFTGQGVTGSDAIRVFALDPAIQATLLERSLSKFDARWVTSMTWQNIDVPTALGFLAAQNTRDAASLNITLAKPLPTGGVAGITFNTEYSKFGQGFTNQILANPNYIPRLQFSFEQPLMRLFGIEVNQLAPTHPGSTLFNLPPSGGQGTEGILISRIRVDQSRAEFDVRVNYLLANVETAYWNLYAAYYNLFAQEEGLRQAFEGYRFITLRVAAGNQNPQDADQARAQFERFRRLVYQARGQVLEAERNLRGLMGLRSDDGKRLVPIDKPNEAPYVPDFYEAANEALANRPELLQARQELKVRQLNLLLQKNLRQPDVRAFGQYDIAGIGTRLDGSLTYATLDPNTGQRVTVPGNALSSLVNNNFNSWTLGIRMDIPLGFRDANASVREAQLSLARSYYQLRDAELKVLEYLVQAYRRVVQTHAEIAPARDERRALQVFLGKNRELIDIGRWDSAFYQQYLQVQRDLANAIAQEYRAIADYNAALAAFEFAKGTIQRYNNVKVSEGPLPPWVQKKAADHIRERTEHALILRERDALGPPAGAGAIGGTPVGPAVGQALLDDLPPFARKREPLPEGLPEPRTLEPVPNPKRDGKDGKPDGKTNPSPLPMSTGAAGLDTLIGTDPVEAGRSRRGNQAAISPDDYFRPAAPPTPNGTMPPRGTYGPSQATPPLPSPANAPPALPFTGDSPSPAAATPPSPFGSSPPSPAAGLPVPSGVSPQFVTPPFAAKSGLELLPVPPVDGDLPVPPGTVLPGTVPPGTVP